MPIHIVSQKTAPPAYRYRGGLAGQPRRRVGLRAAGHQSEDSPSRALLHGSAGEGGAAEGMVIVAAGQCAARSLQHHSEDSPARAPLHARTPLRESRRGRYEEVVASRGKHRPGGAPERGLKSRQALDQKRRARYLTVDDFLSQAPGYAAIAWELLFPSPSFATNARAQGEPRHTG